MDGEIAGDEWDGGDGEVAGHCRDYLVFAESGDRGNGKIRRKEPTAQDEHLPALRQSSYQVLDALHVGRSEYDHCCAAELLECGCLVVFASVDVHVCAEFFGEGFFLAAA